MTKIEKILHAINSFNTYKNRIEEFKLGENTDYGYLDIDAYDCAGMVEDGLFLAETVKILMSNIYGPKLCVDLFSDLD